MNAIRLAAVCIGAAIGLVLGVMVTADFPYPGGLTKAATMVAVFVVTVFICYGLGSLVVWLGRRPGDEGGGER